MNERIIKPGVVKMIIDHTKTKNKKYTRVRITNRVNGNNTHK